MRAMRSSNPAMAGAIYEKAAAGFTGSSVMTINGTITKIGLMLLLVIAAASYTWSMCIGANTGGALTFHYRFGNHLHPKIFTGVGTYLCHS